MIRKMLPLLVGLISLGFAPAPVHKLKPSSVTSDEAKVSKAATTFVETCGKNDHATLKQMIDYPFRLILPCKGGSITDWDEFKERFLTRYGKDIPSKEIKVVQVVTPAQYAKSLGVDETDPFFETFDDGVWIAYLTSNNSSEIGFALLVRVKGKSVRVVGFGIAARSKTE